MMPEFLFGPTSHEEAVDFIRSKPVVAQDVFHHLLPALKARAFVVAGVEAANVVQRVRDEIATLPAGGDWRHIRRQIAEDIHPYLADPADPENLAEAMRRAELLIRTHGFQAYQAANVATMQRQADVMPYWQYLSMQDGRVRDSHRALDGKVLPHDHPFWHDHTPPWEWGCRCQIVPLSPEDVEEINAREKDKAPEERSVLAPQVLAELERTGRLVTGPNMLTDVRSPKQKGTPGAFEWDPLSLSLPMEQLESRYDPPVWAAFQDWAKKTPIPEMHLTVWEWLSGQRIIPPTAPTSLPHAQHNSIDQIFSTLGLDKKLTWEKDDVLSLRKSLIKKDKATYTNKLAEIGGDDLKKKGVGSKAWVRRQFKEIFSYLPRNIAEALPKLTIHINTHAEGAFGIYDHVAHSIRIGRQTCLSSPGGEDQFRETVWHEIMHWIHFHGPQSYRDAIARHFQSRTKGEPVTQLVPYNAWGRRDKWWDAYAGTQYAGQSFESDDGQGIEVPTRYFQLLANPEKLIRQRDPMFQAYADQFDETLKEVLRVFTL